MTSRPLLFRGSFAGLVCSVLSGAAHADSTAQVPVVCAQDRLCFEQLKRGLVQSKSDRAAALLTLQDAYREYPDPRLCYNLGRLLHQLNRPAEAIAHYRRFLESGVENRPEILIKARTYLEQLEREAAAPRATSSLQEDGFSVPIGRESAKPQRTDISPQNLPGVSASQTTDHASPIVPEPSALPPTALTQATSVQVKEQPLYKNWWLWTIVGVGGIGAALGLGFGLAARRPDVTDAAIVRPYGG